MDFSWKAYREGGSQTKEKSLAKRVLEEKKTFTRGGLDDLKHLGGRGIPDDR